MKLRDRAGDRGRSEGRNPDSPWLSLSVAFLHGHYITAVELQDTYVEAPLAPPAMRATENIRAQQLSFNDFHQFLLL